MNFDYSAKVKTWQEKLTTFMDQHIYTNEQSFENWVEDPQNQWRPWPGLEPLKETARQEGLWNLFLSKAYHPWSPGLTNLEYAPLAEIMGRVLWAPEVFNCNAPDTGNMEVLAKYGTPEQQEQWLNPLLDGSIRSAFLMTEPQVASSDATNIETSIIDQGDTYVINGRKWWSSGAMDERCRIFIVMGKTNPNAPRHLQQSMVLVPKNTPGVQIVRPLSAMGNVDAPGGHAEIILENVVIPKSNMLLGAGRGFEIAQGRLGPGRIHHCMRLIGMAQRCLELMCRRVHTRSAFGRQLKDFSSIRQEIAYSRCEIEQARLLTLEAADKIDKYGVRQAKDLIAMIKIVAPKMTQTVADRAIQIYGGMGVSNDVPLFKIFSWARILRLADGPDEVHLYQLGKNTIKQYYH